MLIDFVVCSLISVAPEPFSIKLIRITSRRTTTRLGSPNTKVPGEAQRRAATGATAANAQIGNTGMPLSTHKYAPQKVNVNAHADANGIFSAVRCDVYL